MLSTGAVGCTMYAIGTCGNTCWPECWLGFLLYGWVFLARRLVPRLIKYYNVHFCCQCGREWRVQVFQTGKGQACLRNVSKTNQEDYVPTWNCVYQLKRVPCPDGGASWWTNPKVFRCSSVAVTFCYQTIPTPLPDSRAGSGQGFWCLVSLEAKSRFNIMFVLFSGLK